MLIWRGSSGQSMNMDAYFAVIARLSKSDVIATNGELMGKLNERVIKLHAAGSKGFTVQATTFGQSTMYGASFNTMGIADFLSGSKKTPSLIPVDSWNTSSYTANGTYIASRINPNYNGTPVLGEIPFSLTVNVEEQYWQIIFGPSIQVTNVIKAHTLIGNK